MQIAHIIVHSKELPFGRGRELTYSWEGPKNGVATINYFFAGDLEHLKKGLPYPFKVIKRDPVSDEIQIVRTDGALIFSSWYYYLKSQLIQRLRWIKTRIIMTGYVWGLAYVPPGEIPEWNHFGKRG
jgi:hypothetical protein